MLVLVVRLAREGEGEGERVTLFENKQKSSKPITTGRFPDLVVGHGAIDSPRDGDG